MEHSYPVNLEPIEGERVFVHFPDVPEAITEVWKSESVLAEALDCLVAALGDYVNDGRPLPKPSKKQEWQGLVSLPTLMVAKLALYQLMQERKMTREALSEKLGVSKSAIRRLLDLDYCSHIDEVDKAISCFGKEIVLEVRDIKDR